MYNKKKREHTDPLFKKSKSLKLEDHIEYRLLLTMKCCSDEDSPEHLRRLIERTTNNRRSNNTATVPRYKTTLGQQQAPYQGPLRWNKLPQEIRALPTKKLKKALKKSYIEKY